MTAKTQKWLNTGAFLGMVVVNALANIIPIGIGSTGEVSQKYPNLFTPAPVTFAIWGVIYLLMGVFVLYQWGLFDAGRNSDVIRQKTGLWFVISCVLNIGWIFAWHGDVIWLSVILIAALLLSLIVLSRRCRISGMRTADHLCVTAGFDIYFGWIIAATIANISVFLTKLGWNGFGLSDTFWTAAVLLAGAGIGMAAVFFSRRLLTAATLIWAYTGILIRHISQDGEKGEYPVVIAFAIAGIVLLACSIFLACVKRQRGCPDGTKKA